MARGICGAEAGGNSFFRGLVDGESIVGGADERHGLEASVGVIGGFVAQLDVEQRQGDAVGDRCGFARGARAAVAYGIEVGDGALDGEWAGLVSFARAEGECVVFGVDGDGAEAELGGGADDADGDFVAVGDEEAGQRHRGVLFRCACGRVSSSAGRRPRTLFEGVAGPISVGSATVTGRYVSRSRCSQVPDRRECAARLRVY